MREHKYRAWDKKTEQIVGVVAIVYSDFQIGEGCNDNWGDPIVDIGIWINVGGDCFIEEPRDFKNIELMQYIGKKDAKNKEIYEGDWLKWGDDFYWVDWDEFNGCWYGEPHLDNINIGILTAHSFKDTEITGNIFETPAIAKGAK